MIIYPFVEMRMEPSERIFLVSRIFLVALLLFIQDAKIFLKRQAIVTIQITTWLLFARPFCRSKGITSDVPIPYKQSAVVYANHIGDFDFIYIYGALPWKTFLKLVPFRSFTKNILFEKRSDAFFYRLLGCFPAHHTKDNKGGIKEALKYLDNNESILIFPEGRKRVSDVKHKLKPGLGVLGLRRNTLVLPVRIETKGKRHIKKISWLNPVRSRDIVRTEAMDITEQLFSVITSTD